MARKRKSTSGSIRRKRGAAALKLPQQMKDRSYIDNLKKVHMPFMLYTGAHSIINAGQHAWGSTEGGILGLILVFSIAGIIGLEYVGYNLFHAIVDRSVIGRQKSFCVFAYIVIMGTICYGIQSHYSANPTFSLFYYSYLLPASPIIVLLLVLRVYLIDPFKEADEEEAALALEANTLARRAKNERIRYQVREQKEWMKLDWATFEKRIQKLWEVAQSWKTSRMLKASAKTEYYLRLEKVHKLHLPQQRSRKLIPFFGGKKNQGRGGVTKTEVGDVNGDGVPDYVTTNGQAPK